MKNKLYLIPILLSWVAMIPLAAQDLGLHTMKNVWQSNRTNPAMVGDAKFVFSLPGFTTSAGNSAFSYNQLITTNANGETVLNGNHLVSLLDEENVAWSNLDVETFSVHFGGKNWRVFLSHAFRSSFSAEYPKTLAQIVFEGNAQFIGQEVDIAPQFSGTVYGETGIGTAIQFNQFTIGTRIKLLSGVANVSSDRHVANLFTADNSIYELTINSDYRFNTAGIVDVTGFDDTEVDTEVEILDPSFGILGQNKGFAVDFGITYAPSEKWQLSASILDLGKITWKENTKNFTSQGTFTFKGIDLIDVIDDDSLAFENTVDTLTDIFNFQESQQNYSTNLSMNSFFSAAYQFNDYFRMGATINLRSFNGKLNPTYALSANADFGKVFSLGTVMSHNTFSSFNVGLNAALKLGPVQLFALSDNFLSAFKVLDSNYAQFRFGFNLTFGSHRSEQHNDTKNATPEDRLSTIRN
ncbi:MAG: DUF5723 family protein [Bacteroidota bacterium]